MIDHVSGSVVWNGKNLEFTDQVVFNVAMTRMQPGVGEEFSLTVERLLAARTSTQNREYWGFIVRPVSLYTKGAMSLNDVHRLYKAELLPSERFSLVNAETGEVKLERDLELHTTRRLSEEEFRDYMERARVFACENVGLDMSDQGLWDQFGIGRG